MTGATTSVQSVDRAMTILAILARNGDSGVTEVAAELGVHKSTAFRLLATLETHRMVEQVGERGLYRLGAGNLRLAGATTARLDVVTEARDVCRQLATTTGETVNLAVFADTAALYVDQVAGTSALQSHNWVGQRIPLHATSNGKVLLSEMSEDAVRLAVRELPQLTEKTITSHERLTEELAHVRQVGYALANNELEIGLSAVAAPIRNVRGDVIASLSVSGPSFRLTDERIAGVIPDLLAAATEVSHRLGWWHHD
ncbi:IclR family transcriptional regulator [Nocardioides baekrokdamisoli]|uniref:IclR family transcriptional regulator n=2 Tax=Nocardioides baekrokdamisoli TaxID=1804624 RepID=A0A3G9IBT8_9ACTN|nr:IclR family transcriptional regulator [Nocardioides baekrokdamisoli]